MKEIEIYKSCPNCGTISGFYVTEKQIREDEVYFCQECKMEHKLSKWKESNRDNYEIQDIIGPLGDEK